MIHVVYTAENLVKLIFWLNSHHFFNYLCSHRQPLKMLHLLGCFLKCPYSHGFINLKPPQVIFKSIKAEKIRHKVLNGAWTDSSDSSPQAKVKGNSNEVSQDPKCWWFPARNIHT